MHARKSQGCYEGTLGRNMDVKGCSGEVSDGNEERFIGNWRKGDLCYKVAMNLAELFECFVKGRVYKGSNWVFSRGDF